MLLRRIWKLWGQEWNNINGAQLPKRPLNNFPCVLVPSNCYTTNNLRDVLWRLPQHAFIYQNLPATCLKFSSFSTSYESLTQFLIQTNLFKGARQIVFLLYRMFCDIIDSTFVPSLNTSSFLWRRFDCLFLKGELKLCRHTYIYIYIYIYSPLSIFFPFLQVLKHIHHVKSDIWNRF